MCVIPSHVKPTADPLAPSPPAPRSHAWYREQQKIRRPRSSLNHGIDRWENSGGRKGSTTWPADKPRLRCQYGKVTREGRGPLKYHEYTFIQPHESGGSNRHLPAELLQRHLYMVLPAGQGSGAQRHSSNSTQSRKAEEYKARSPPPRVADIATVPQQQC